MKMQIVALRDIKTDSYSIPQFVANIPGWVRALGDVINERGSKETIAMHPEDFEAWHIGEFDDNNGKIYNFEDEDGFPTDERKQIIALANLKR